VSGHVEGASGREVKAAEDHANRPSDLTLGRPPIREPLRLFLASSNPGKLREYREMAAMHGASGVELELFPEFFERPAFPESAPTFAENAAGKALHYSRFTELPVIADDSGLEVTALGGSPGVRSARYAGAEASQAQRNARLQEELRLTSLIAAGAKKGAVDRTARFVCVIAVAARGRVAAVLSAEVTGEIVEEARGEGGFGYDPLFFFPPLGKTFAEMSAAEKNIYSHRGKAFRKMLEFLGSSLL
jgi:XTP/dITP diphosphohydrolase